jgi:fatty-acyl-CoA synthase
MRLVDYLDKGASLGPDRPCLTTDGSSLSYAEVVDLSHRMAAALVARGVTPGGKVAILSGNDPIAFSCLFGLSRAARCGARSTRAMRRPRTASCSTSSIAKW